MILLDHITKDRGKGNLNSHIGWIKSNSNDVKKMIIMSPYPE